MSETRETAAPGSLRSVEPSWQDHKAAARAILRLVNTARREGRAGEAVALLRAMEREIELGEPPATARAWGGAMSDAPSTADIRRAAREHKRYTYAEQKAYQTATLPLLERWKDWNTLTGGDHMCRARGTWWEVDHTDVPKRDRWAFASPALDDQWRLFGRVMAAVKLRRWPVRIETAPHVPTEYAVIITSDPHVGTFGKLIGTTTVSEGKQWPVVALLTAYLDAAEATKEDSES